MKGIIHNTRILFVLLLFCNFGQIYAQQKTATAYEKKKEELLVQVWSKFGQRAAARVSSLSDKTDKEIYKIAEDAELGALLLGYYTPEMQATKWYSQELKKAQKLKTNGDFQREIEKTDKGSIKREIKDTFEKWNQRGEFEKQVDYEERLQIKSQTILVQICIEQIKNKIVGYNNDKDLKMELLPYNADDEFFTVKFSINGIEWQSKITVPIAGAVHFKNNWSSLKSEINKYDWCFVNNSLCPIFITLSDGISKFQFTLPLQNQSEIIFSFDDSGIDNQYLKGFIFKYSNAKAIDLKIAQEKYVKDSLIAHERQIRDLKIAQEKLIKDSLDNIKLETAFQNFNNQLLANPYNIDKIVISNYEKISMGGNNYTTSHYSLNRNYEKIKKEVETTFNSAYSDAKPFFPAKEEFEYYYRQGMNTALEELENRKEKKEEEQKLNYFISKTVLIESTSFQKENKESVGSAVGRRLIGAALSTDIEPLDYTNENEARKTILSEINECRNKSYYLKVLDLVFSANKDLNKEWTKNGEYFSNKAELYEAYISGDYKQILKNKK